MKQFLQTNACLGKVIHITRRQLAVMLMLTGISFAAVSKEQNPLERDVTLNFENIKLVKALDEIEKTVDVKFIYSKNFVSLKEEVTINAQNEKLSSVLNRLLTPFHIQYGVVKDRIVLNKRKDTASTPLTNLGTLNANLFQQPDDLSALQATITGTVFDSDGQALPGVNVLVKGTSNGTTTDANGKFSLAADPATAVLVFSFIGYTTQEVPAGGRSVIDVTLDADTRTLNEVVVVGYGTQRKSDVTGSVGVVKGSDLLTAPVNNALQGLKGKVAGVNVFLNSGSPTASPRVVIRGVGTINAASGPLFVVDGVVMEDIKYLNPNDIESMEVLKDASSTAIYGSRGANGVILVTTKRGAATEGMVIGYDGFVSAGHMRKEMDLLNAKEWLDVVRTGIENSPKYNPSASPAFTANDPRLFDANGNPLYDTDWQKEATRTAISYNHQLSIQQKSEKSSVGAFLNYSRMEGIMLNSWMNRVSGKIAYDANPTKWLTVGVNLLANVIKENEVEETGGHQMPRRTMIEMPPIFPVKFPDGTWAASNMVTDAYSLEAMANPVHVLETQDRLRKRTQLFGNVYMTFHLLPGLDLRTQFGFDQNERDFQEYSPTDLVNISSPNGRARVESQRINYWQEETYLSYNKELGTDHRINAVLGLSWQERVYDRNFVEVEGFADNFFRYNRLQAGSIPKAPESEYEKWAMNSYFLRGGYTYRDKYMLTVTGRVDGSSRFGKNNKYAFFPSAGLGWMVSSEPFMQDIASLTEFKLRSSFGYTGNTEIGYYRSLSTVESGNTLINGTRGTEAHLRGIANPDLKWEKTRQFDVGFNMGWFNNRLQLEFDYYHRLTTDLLLDRPVPYSSGFKTVTANIGSVSNRGIEGMITSVNAETNDFRWTTSLNFNRNKNKIEKLGENDEDIFPGPNWVSGSQTILRVGESLSSFWGYERLGTWSTDEAEEAAERGYKPGEAKRSVEKKIIGKGLPDWTGSFINTFRYKNWDLTVDLQFVYGVDILQQFFHSTEDRSGIANGLRTILTDSWTPERQNTMVQEIRHQGRGGQNSEVDSHWVADGSYLRGNLFSLGYTVNSEMLERLKLRNLRVYANVQNAFVIDSKEFKGYDPEATSWTGNDAQWGQNIFFFQYPKPTTYTLGVNLQF
ncbi:SusC/RagA family TonB-linked outer membrane protein [Dawidia soli]|nr:TonB-dependent receptor [Dawidia soli]